MTGLDFSITAKDGLARRGKLKTAHGVIDTPAFMPVGTAATVKGILPEQVAATGAQIVLGNTYHLMLRRGAERVARLGGLHTFMNWNKPILTDSGGFQVMSLSQLRKISEEGVKFQSHIDGSTHFLSPERAMEIQDLLDANITMVLDECTPYPATYADARLSMERSMRWAARCRESFRQRQGYGLFGIVQGSTYEDLRLSSIQALGDIGFDGYAIGGLAVGEGQDKMLEVLDFTAPALPVDAPRYLMGVGKPGDLVESVCRGIDMFDCVLPTRCGRTGLAFTTRGTVNLRNARHKDDPRPLDPESDNPVCRDYSRAYLHHLVRSGEMLGPILLTLHNLYFYQDLMRGLRHAIENGRLAEFRHNFKGTQARGDMEAVA